MSRILVLVFLLTAPAWAADVPFTANLKNWSSSPVDSYLLASIADCGAGNIPRVLSGANAGVKSLEKQQLDPDGTGLVSTTITPNADITCGVSTGTTRYLIEIMQRGVDGQKDKRIFYAYYTVASPSFDLATADPNPSVPAPATANAVLKNPTATQNVVQPTGTSLQVTGAGGTDMTAAGFTRPVKTGTTAAKDAITSCTANKDFFGVTDPAASGQVLFRCNSAGNGWDLVGGAGGAIGPGTAGKLPKFTGVGATLGDSIVSESGSGLSATLSMTGNLKVLNEADLDPAFTLLSTPKWQLPAPNSQYHERRQFKIGGLDTGGVSAGSSGGGLYLFDPLNSHPADPQLLMRLDIPTSQGGTDIQANYYTTQPDIAASANKTGPFTMAYGKFPNAGCLTSEQNHVVRQGWNVGKGGGTLNPFQPSWALVWESNYQPTSCDFSMPEFHLEYVAATYKPNGAANPAYAIRPISAVVKESITAGTYETQIGLAGNLIAFRSNTDVLHSSFDNSGNLSVGGTVTGTRLISTIANGTAPLGVTSTTEVTNLRSATATALAANPGDCAADNYATTIAADGTLTCAAITDASIAATIARDSEVTSAINALSSVYQPLDSDLTTIAGLTATTENFMVAAASAWASRTPAQARTSLGLATVATSGSHTDLSNIGTNTHAQIDTHLAATTAHSSTSVNTASRIVERDASGDFAAGAISANVFKPNSGTLASAGLIRQANNASIFAARNAGNTADCTWKLNVSDEWETGCAINVTAAGAIVLVNQSAPSTPASGQIALWGDSTDKVAKFKDDAGNVSTSVRADAGASNNFLTGITTAGVITKAQPAFTNISGTATIAQGGTGTGSTLAGLVRGSASAMTAAELSGVVVTSASNVTTPGKVDVMQSSFFCSDAGANDTYTCNLSPAATAYVSGTHYRFLANTVNTGAATINFNSLGAKTIKKVAGGITTDLADNDIRSGQWVELVYDGTNMQMQSTLGNAGGGGAPTDAQYLALATNGTLSAERVLTAGTGVAFADAGAGSTLTVSTADAIPRNLKVAGQTGASTTTTGAFCTSGLLVYTYTLTANTLAAGDTLEIRTRLSKSGTTDAVRYCLAFGGTVCHAAVGSASTDTGHMIYCTITSVSSTAQHYEGSTIRSNGTRGDANMGTMAITTSSNADITVYAYNVNSTDTVRGEMFLVRLNKAQ